MHKLILSIALITAAMPLAGCKKAPDMKPPPRVVSVLTTEAVTRDIPNELSSIGQVEAASTVSVRPLIGGLVQKISFREGQDVRKGDLLITIDPRPFEIAVQQAEAALARDSAQRAKAAVDDERYKKLLASGFVSQSDYDQTHVTLTSLDATLKSDQAAVNMAKLNLSYCFIHAPASGRTGVLMVREGTLLKANDDQAVVVIQSIEPVYVNFSLPESYLSQLRDRYKTGKLTVNVTPTDGSTGPITGKVTFLDSAVDRATGTIKLKALISNNDRKLWPSQFVNASLTLSTVADAVAVPNEAVQTGQKGDYVFVIKPSDMTAELRPVKVGPSSGGLTAILNGVASGDRVVTDGHLRLTPGVKVALKDSPAQDGRQPKKDAATGKPDAPQPKTDGAAK